MATTDEATDVIRLDLEMFAADLVDLPDLAEEWDDLDEGPRATLSHDWDQQMAILRWRLEPAYRSGSMTPSQQQQYRELHTKLRDAPPYLQRLGLQCPPVALEQ